MIEDTKVIDLTVATSGGGGTSDYTDISNKPQINSTTLSGNKSSSDLGLQDALVSGTNIKTINSTSLLGAGDVTVQETLVSGTNIKTINNTSLLGSGDITISSGGTYTAGTGLRLADSAFNVLQEDYGVDPMPLKEGTGVTESGGVYTNFSNGNYIYLDRGLNLSTTDEFEIVMKVKTSGSGSQNKFFITTDNDFYLGKGSNANQIQGKGNGKSVSLTDSTAFSTSDWRWYKYVRTVSEGTATLYVAYSTDGTNWTNGTSTTAVAAALTSSKIYFGVGSNGLTPLSGSIDINGCYIKINGEYWWNPAQSTYKPVAKATSSLYGLVKPDGTSITVSDGVISADVATMLQGITGYNGTTAQTLGHDASGNLLWS